MNTSTRKLKTIHLSTVVYGKDFINNFLKITLLNLNALIKTIPNEIRKNSVYKIVTSNEDKYYLETSSLLKKIKKIISVEILTYIDEFNNINTYDDYSKMVLSQERLVIEASKNQAAIIFIGPDLIFEISNHFFRFFINKLGVLCASHS